MEEARADSVGCLFAARGVRYVFVFRFILAEFTIGRVADELVGVRDQLEGRVNVAGPAGLCYRGAKPPE